MSDFSIELSAERIDNPNTKKYFAEVYSSYVNENYRSAIVMLWSVVVCDLLYKLSDAASLYGDTTAGKLLNETETERRNDPKSPSWEATLVKQANERTHLITLTECQQLEKIQADRHLCAHPVLNMNYELYTPSKELVRAHMRTALESLLIKPALLTRKVIDAILTDLEQNKASLFTSTPQFESVSNYLRKKYFYRLTQKALEFVFKDLWKIVFIKDDADCESNRVINYFGLRSLYVYQEDHLRGYIEQHKDEFSNVNGSDNRIKLLSAFLRYDIRLFGLLTEPAQQVLRGYLNTDDDLYSMAWYLADNVDSHIDEVVTKIMTRDTDASKVRYEVSKVRYMKLIAEAAEGGFASKAIRIGSAMYGRSKGFDDADTRFGEYIAPYLNYYDRDSLLNLVAQIENNNQTYGRGRARLDHGRIKDRGLQLVPPLDDFTDYPEFASHLPITQIRPITRPDTDLDSVEDDDAIWDN